MNSLDQGRWAETEALKFLEQQGCILCKKNFHSRYGEIDLIVQENEILVFIEVRYRRSSFFGQAAETVNAAKKIKIKKTAEYFLLIHSVSVNTFCRFDVITLTAEGGCPRIEWIKNAF